MEQENDSASISPEKAPVSATTGRNRATASSAYETPGGVTIDFHSAELNRTDDLNDCSGNYRSFQTLDGVVTAHERHQMERGRHTETVDPHVDDASTLKKAEKGHDEAGAVEAVAPLTVISRGRTLIIDTDAERARACAKRLDDQRLVCTTLLVTKSASAGSAFPKLSRLVLLEVDGVSVTGAFSRFSATVTVKGDRKHLREWLGDDAAAFDLVLDLQPTPSFAGDCLPVGYYAPGPSSTALDDAMAELPEMRGRFKKPQFISFQEACCLRCRSRVHECRQCLEVCPSGAIQSADHNISIDHYLCQGCGGCALVCPADAIHLIQPSRQEMLTSLRSRLENRSSAAHIPPTLIIYDSGSVGSTASETSERSCGHDVYFKVEQISQVRLEMLLAALAYGAGAVLVACGPQNSPKITKAVEWQVQMARAILRGLALPEDKCRIAEVPQEDINAEITDFKQAGIDAQTINAPAPCSSTDGRTLVRLMAQHLYDQSGAHEPRLSLPVGAPFGAVAVNAAACTLCMACAAACPARALSVIGNVPRILFRESRCHQCGLCAEICPEGAIQLLPRLLCDPEGVEAQTVLYDAEPLRCVECGVPFASHTMIKRIQEKLKSHWMYANERQIRRLQMCGTCRARDTLTSPEMKAWNS